MPYGLLTKMEQSTGPENIAPQRPVPGMLAREPVHSYSRTTLENNGKIWQLPDRETAFATGIGGGNATEIQPSPPDNMVFKTGALNHSATPPTSAL
jgi:hypothetical protein